MKRACIDVNTNRDEQNHASYIRRLESNFVRMEKKSGFILFILLAVACHRHYIPKPKGYFRIDFPAKKYQLFDRNFPYSFEYPVYGKMVKDSDLNTEPYWMNLVFKKYKAKLHLTYKMVNGNVSKYIEDSHTLAYKHIVKADAIDEHLVIDKKRKVYGLIYDIRGNAASSVQFYLTDSVHNFLRGSFYFRAVPNKDSLAPAIAFFRKDIVHLIQTLEWEKTH